MADYAAEQQTLDAHVRSCEKCLRAKNINDCCQTGRILARILESIKTR
jgi:hypothetical protein